MVAELQSPSQGFDRYQLLAQLEWAMVCCAPDSMNHQNYGPTIENNRLKSTLHCRQDRLTKRLLQSIESWLHPILGREDGWGYRRISSFSQSQLPYIVTLGARTSMNVHCPIFSYLQIANIMSVHTCLRNLNAFCHPSNSNWATSCGSSW